ncbi:MAG: shikimate kinase [Lachnotalea sp.]
MRNLEEIREQISQCDDQIVKSLEKRMDYIQEIIQYKQKNGLPILQPEQEKKQNKALVTKLQNHKFEEEILDVFKYIVKNSRKIQAKSLFSYNIMLIGFMGAGKSTVSSYLSHLLEMEEVDTDQLIVEKEGMSISQIFEKYGEAYFRNCESNTLIELQRRKQLIVSCGGGIVLRDENVQHMKKRGRIVLLTANPETTLERVKDSTQRPILNNNMNTKFIAELMEKRKDKYLAASDIIVSTDNKTIAQVCEEVVAKLTEME